jgi:alanyl-tRNA synthetase
MVKEKAKHRADVLIEKTENNRVFEVVDANRKEMIEMANDIIAKDPKITVILSNQAGDIIGMSKSEDMGKKIREICRMAGGSGGGKKEFAQGRAELSKLLKLKDRF